MRRPGIEPGSTAWKAAMLTTIPPTLSINLRINWLSIHGQVFFDESAFDNISFVFSHVKKERVRCMHITSGFNYESKGFL